jgi:hypothetical protein
MVRIVVRMQPEAQIEFPEMEIPLLLDIGAVRPTNRPGQSLLGVGLRSNNLTPRSGGKP